MENKTKKHKVWNKGKKSCFSKETIELMKLHHSGGRKKGSKVSEDEKNKIRKTLAENYKNGKVQKKISKSMLKYYKNNSVWNKGKTNIYSDETLENISKSVSANAKINPNFGMKGKHHSEETIKIIKEKRKHQHLPTRNTLIEVKIQNFLKQLGLNFLTHQYIKDIKHHYHCDILIPSLNLVIECDGNYWHKYPIGNDIDHIRTSELLQKGFKVLRLWEFEINKMSVEEFKKRLNIKSGK